MAIVAYGLLFLLTIKCVYNLAVPYLLLKKKEGEGISFMPYVEMLLLLFVVIVSVLGGGESLKTASIVASGVVVISYLHFVLVMVVGGWFLKGGR